MQPAAGGTLCRPARDTCDAAEVCDGTSALCPLDSAAPDGTACGTGMPPCRVEECAAGACRSQLVPGWCVIDEQCVAAGRRRADGCASCDPSRTVDDWSMEFTPDPTGMRCRLSVIMDASGRTCDGIGAAAIVGESGRLTLLLARLHDPPSNFQRRRLKRRVLKLFRVARRYACETDDASQLVAQARGFLSALPPR